MGDADPPVSRQSLWRAIEPLWIAALGVQFIVLGGLFLPRFIRLLGRGGAIETVEWAVYMSTLFVFPPAVWLVGWIVPRVAGPRRATLVRRGLVLMLVIEFAVYAVLRATPSLLIAAIAAGLFGIVALKRSPHPIVTLVLAAVCGTAGWMASGGLVSWDNARHWMFARAVTQAALLGSVIVVAEALRRWTVKPPDARNALRLLELLPLAALVTFSFRTFPMAEHFHWGFFVGPIEQLRQGGTLLWDTPSQYGFLSILIASVFPGNAWQSFWFFQSLAYAIVACMVYLAIRRLSPGWWSAVASFLITFTVLFFRPRTDSLILPAQMTPAAGPVRFIWCFVMLAFLLNRYGNTRRDQQSPLFVVIGTVIWATALLWSAETAIYVTAMWFPAYLINTLQSAAASADTSAPRRAIAWMIAKRAAIPVGAMLLIGFVVLASYHIVLAAIHGRRGVGVDLAGHIEYVLLYSRGGFGALPIDPTGPIWYLVISFLVVSTILALHALGNPRDPRLVVWAAAWGGIWAISSYFTGRSHPVNLIALVPVLIFVLAVCMHLRPFEGSTHARYVVAASVLPLFAMPVALTAGHRSFFAAVTEPQVSPARFAEQVPLMDPDLQSLLTTAGAKPTDSFVLVSDGRLMLQAWRVSGLPTAVGNPDTTRVLITRSWLPKAFEIVGSLPEHRRQIYFERNALSFPEAGWLVQSKSLTANGADHLLRFVQSSRREERRFESDKWIVSWMERVRRPSD